MQRNVPFIRAAGKQLQNHRSIKTHLELREKLCRDKVLTDLQTGANTRCQAGLSRRCSDNKRKMTLQTQRKRC
ncbi:hypothetical protein NQZ68_022343 [Dissostichus eleginoides]|nr:hypothetical protein NQZ68_022343 [Dissostichus eleginoides]